MPLVEGIRREKRELQVIQHVHTRAHVYKHTYTVSKRGEKEKERERERERERKRDKQREKEREHVFRKVTKNIVYLSSIYCALPLLLFSPLLPGRTRATQIIRRDILKFPRVRTSYLDECDVVIRVGRLFVFGDEISR